MDANLRLILRLQLIEAKSRQDGEAIGKIENIDGGLTKNGHSRASFV